MIKTDLQKKREYDEYSKEYISKINGTYEILERRMDRFSWYPTEENTNEIHNYALSLKQDIEEFLDFMKETQHTTSPQKERFVEELFKAIGQ